MPGTCWRLWNEASFWLVAFSSELLVRYMLSA
jgi:hypothetical protein